ncbi:MAG: hypothetical protein ACUVT0_00100, partial [Thermochromatium sp.]
MVERWPLDEDRRLAYLEAMGVRVWKQRTSVVAMADPVSVELPLEGHTEEANPIECMGWDAL